MYWICLYWETGKDKVLSVFYVLRTPNLYRHLIHVQEIELYFPDEKIEAEKS